jgi:hypothetical protein
MAKIEIRLPGFRGTQNAVPKHVICNFRQKFILSGLLSGNSQNMQEHAHLAVLYIRQLIRQVSGLGESNVVYK